MHQRFALLRPLACILCLGLFVVAPHVYATDNKSIGESLSSPLAKNTNNSGGKKVTATPKSTKTAQDAKKIRAQKVKKTEVK